MASPFTEKQVHDEMYLRGGLEEFVQDSPSIEAAMIEAEYVPPDIAPDEYVGPTFELWRFVKLRALQKIGQLHRTVRYGDFIGSKINLRTDDTKPMQLDLLGRHESGLFIVELKVEKSAERNAFSELFAYSNYIAEMFALSGAKDITNVLVANLDNKITGQSFLYDLLIADRNVIVYRPSFPDVTVKSLQLELYIPSDDDFKHLTNRLLSHETMDCVVVSFDDLPKWFDSEEEGGSLNEYTVDHLSKLSSYGAQLMEAERLHGFCFVRKRWKEIPSYYRNSLIFCAVNPFRVAEPERANDIIEQLDDKKAYEFFEAPELGFDGRLFSLAKRTIKDGLTHDYDCELESAIWSGMLTSSIEVVYTHNFGFRPTGMLREAFVSYLNIAYADSEAGLHDLDFSKLKVNELQSWFRAWEFMEMCGFVEGGISEPDTEPGDDDTEGS